MNKEEEIPNNNNTEVEETNNDIEIIKEPELVFEELFPIVEEQQAYVALQLPLSEVNPPTLIIYSHGSNTTVTQNMEDQFMKDLQSYATYLTPYNFIFAASAQHGVNWGNQASISDTLNLINWIKERYTIQPKVYMIGFSMGGLPTLNFAYQYPDLISKIALLAPSTKTSTLTLLKADSIKDIDIQIWHGNKDVNVPYSSVVTFVNAMKTYGKEIPLVTLEGKTHFDIDTEYMEDILQFFNGE